jgi:hypothetical protein
MGVVAGGVVVDCGAVSVDGAAGRFGAPPAVGVVAT